MVSFAYTFERTNIFMTPKKLIKKIFTDACILFSIITALYSIVVIIIHVDDTKVLLDASRVLLFFIASLLVALANSLLLFEKLHKAIRLVAHYLLSAFAFASCLMLPISPDASTMIVGLSLFTVVYLIVMGISALFRRRYKSKSDEDAEYRSQFKK